MKEIITTLVLALSIVSCSNSNSIQETSINQKLDTLHQENQRESDIANNNPMGIKCDIEMLKGTWISNDDKEYEVIITGNLFIHRNKGVEDDTLTYELKDKSEGEPAKNSCYLITSERISDLTYNYTVEIYDKTLSLTYLDRGNRLVFTRK
jgi:uncharacterized protein YcfL